MNHLNSPVGAILRLRCIDLSDKKYSFAGVVKLVDALDSKSSSARSVGSIPTARTNSILLKTCVD